MQTFIGPEEHAYPAGSLRQSRRRFAAVCPDGKIRRGICGIGDTYSTTPAYLKVRGVTVTGHLEMRDDTVCFYQNPAGKNADVFTASWSRAKARDTLRRVTLRPFRSGLGPFFILHMYATPRTDWRGQTRIGYELRRHENGKAEVLFSGEDFAGSPMHADDSDSAVAALLSFLTFGEHDADSEYFDGYTARQIEWRDSHEREALSHECIARFGED